MCVSVCVCDYLKSMKNYVGILIILLGNESKIIMGKNSKVEVK